MREAHGSFLKYVFGVTLTSDDPFSPQPQRPAQHTLSHTSTKSLDNQTKESEK